MHIFNTTAKTESLLSLLFVAFVLRMGSLLFTLCSRTSEFQSMRNQMI